MCAKFLIPTTLVESPAIYRSAFAPFVSEANGDATSPREFNDLAILLTSAAQGYATTDLPFAKSCAYKMLGLGKRIVAYLKLTDELLPDNRVSEQMLELMASNQICVSYKDLLALCGKGESQDEFLKLKRERAIYVTAFKQKLGKYVARNFSRAAN